MNVMVRVEELTKSYSQNYVLKKISFEVFRGEVFALLGVNGAGKTTVMECIEGLRSYDHGVIELGGSLGVQLQDSCIMPECKVKEAVILFSLWNHVRAEMAFKLFDIEQMKDKSYGSLSIGQKKRLHVALAFIRDSDVVILDEPTAGLDVESRILLHKEIRKLKAAGRTILLASRDMTEVEELCDRIAILRDGRIVFTGPPSELKSKVGQQNTISLRLSKDISDQIFRSCEYVDTKEGYLSFRTADIGSTLLEILTLSTKLGIEVRDVRTEHVSLEQRFMEISKGEPV